VNRQEQHATARRAIMVLLVALLTGIPAGCRRTTEAGDPAVEPLVLDMSHGPVSMVLRAEPRNVDLATDVILTIEITAPAEIEVAPLDMENRLQGFLLNGAYSEQLSERGGKRTTVHHARLTPIISSEYRLAPMAVEYEDRSVSPPARGWFPTRPVLFGSVSSPVGSSSRDIRSAVDPVWIPPTFRSVAFLVLGVLALAAILGVAVRLAMKVRTQVQLARMSPRERALKELSRLLAQDLVNRDLVKDFYVELTFIVRRYIERAHSVRAPEQTTEEFLAAVSADPRFRAEVISTLRDFLEASDLVKFAGHRPPPRAVDSAVNTARDYVETDAAGPAPSGTPSGEPAKEEDA